MISAGSEIPLDSSDYGFQIFANKNNKNMILMQSKPVPVS